MVILQDEDEYEYDLIQCFIATEQKLILECGSVVNAIFNLVACHYVFNLEYCTKVKELQLFLQQKVLGIPCAHVQVVEERL